VTPAPGRSRSGAPSATTTDTAPARNRLALALAALPFVLHLAALTNYGFFRDELYFIVCGRHPAFGYVDQPPLVPLLAAGSQAAGESLWLLRIIPALFHVGAVLAACAVVRLLGGGRGAQILAGLGVGCAPLLLGITATLNTTALEPLTWTLVAYAALRAVLGGEPRWWIVAGIVAGIALEDKYSVAFLLAAIVAGLAVAGPRAALAGREFWLGAVVAIALAAPSLVWQTLHSWPFLELLRAGASGKNVVVLPGAWIAGQIVTLGPLFAPVWIAGLVLLTLRARVRFVGVGVLLLFVTFIALHAKDYYLAGIYPLLFAAGGVAIERAVKNAVLRGVYALAATVATLAFAPLALPLLPEPAFVAYAAKLHAGVPAAEHQRLGVLPQYFADMHGWRELADRVGVVERSLSPADRADAAILTDNYGEAAAIDVFGDHGLPVISGHNNYFLWGPQGSHPVLIVVGGPQRRYERMFRDVHQAETVRSLYAMPYENDLPIYVARDPRIDIQKLWPRLRRDI
jgi:4-amino-4-deoxy-L-arabinose transferase-like glycosyltransferase